MLQAVLEMRAFPAGMEMFPSADDEQWAFIQNEILSSDYYVVIVAGKYGSLSESGLSYTEMEYDFAVASGKPVMGFLVKDLGELKGSLLEEDAELKKKLAAFRTKVQRGKLVKFFRNDDELKTQVTQALVHAFQFRPQEGWVRAKNSRRIEDLEEITVLQKRVMHLEAENATLKSLPSDPRTEFLTDVMEFKLALRSAGFVEPPVQEFLLKASLAEIFPAAFASRYPKTNLEVAEEDLVRWARRQVVIEHPAAKAWDEDASGTSGLEKDSARELIARVRNRLIGLGYLDVLDPADVGRKGPEEWLVTERGRLYGLTIAKRAGAYA